MIENNPELNFEQVLKQLRLQLLDLTKRNRLINFKNNKSTITFVDEQPRQVFDYLINGGSMVIDPIPEPKTEELLLWDLKDSLDVSVENAAKMANINLDKSLPQPTNQINDIKERHCDNKLQTNIFSKELDTKLRRIRSNANSIIEETGQNQLFLAMGFLQWVDSKDSKIENKSPLILIPVEIIKGNIDKSTGCYRYNLKYLDEDLIPNISLREKLSQEFGVALPGFEEANTGDSDNDLDPELYFLQVDNMAKNLKGASVKREMYLGFFSFSKLLMYLDLDPERKDLLQNPLVGEILGSTNDDASMSEPVECDDLVEEIENLNLVLDADSSQSELNFCKFKLFKSKWPIDR